MPNFIDRNGIPIFVDRAPHGNWTFYRETRTLKGTGRQRIKVRGSQAWFDTKEEAEVGLAQYATKNRFKEA